MTEIDRLARSTSDLYRIISELTDKGVAFKVVDDPTIDTTNRTGKLVMGILALITEFENDPSGARWTGSPRRRSESSLRPQARAYRGEDCRDSVTARGRNYGPDIIRRMGLSKATSTAR